MKEIIFYYDEKNLHHRTKIYLIIICCCCYGFAHIITISDKSQFLSLQTFLQSPKYRSILMDNCTESVAVFRNIHNDCDNDHAIPFAFIFLA